MKLRHASSASSEIRAIAQSVTGIIVTSLRYVQMHIHRQTEDGMDIGLLLIHGFVGALLFAHGGGHLFGWFGAGGGLPVTTEFLASIGLRPARPLAALLGAAEIAGGLLLAVGLATPLAAALVAQLLVVAAFTDH